MNHFRRVIPYLTKYMTYEQFYELFMRIYDKHLDTIVLVSSKGGLYIEAHKVRDILIFSCLFPNRFYITDVSEPGSKYYETRLHQYTHGCKQPNTLMKDNYIHFENNPTTWEGIIKDGI